MLKIVAPSLGAALLASGKLPGLLTGMLRSSPELVPRSMGGTGAEVSGVPGEAPTARTTDPAREGGRRILGGMGLGLLDDWLRTMGYPRAGAGAGIAGDTLTGAGLGTIFGATAGRLPYLRAVPPQWWSRLGGMLGAGYGAYQEGGDLFQGLGGSTGTTEQITPPGQAGTGTTDQQPTDQQGINVITDTQRPIASGTVTDPMTEMLRLLNLLHTDMEDLNINIKTQTNELHTYLRPGG